MKRPSCLAVLLSLAALPAFASSKPQGVNSQHQFHFASNTRVSKKSKMTSDAQRRFAESQVARPATAAKHPTASSMGGKTPVKHVLPILNPPTGKVGFVSATQVAAGGETYWQAESADFNGDGKPDALTIVQNLVSGTWTDSISVVLNNGNGTFQAPVLSPIPGNDSCAAFVVGDVNGDGKADLLVVHLAGSCGNSTSNFDVLLSNGDGTFTQGNNYVISSNGLVGGVLQNVGNGHLDVVAADNANPSNLWTVLGNGDGTFSSSPTSVALSGQVSQATLTDLNGDGVLDVVDAASYSQVVVYVSTSATTYASGTPLVTSDTVYDGCSVAVGDLSGDGKPEIVTPNCYDDTLTVYVNNGDGSFQTGVYYPVALSSVGGNQADTYPEGAVIADVNGDGKGDIISSNDDSGDVTILLGNGDGTVNVPTIGYATGGYPEQPAIVADFNGDGFLDLLVPDDEFSLVFLKGYGDGSFRAGMDYYAPIADNNYAYGIGIATGDFNGDGIPDVVLGNCCDSTVGITVFLSRADGSMQPGVNYGAGNLYYVAVGDFNGDKKLDIAATNNGNGTVQIFSGNGDGTFTLGSNFPTDTASENPQGLVVADFNGDGFADLAVINESDGNVGILLNDKTGNFSNLTTYTLNASGFQIEAGDLNNDGKVDLLVPINNGDVAVLLGNGDGTFGSEIDSPIGTNPQSAALADLNGDGKLDVAVAIAPCCTGLDQGISLALGNGDGTFQAPTLLASTLQVGAGWSTCCNNDPWPSFVSVTDIDGDGNPDIVYTNSEYATVGILFGQGGGAFYDPVEFPAGGYAYGLAVADVNGDGAPDVVTAGDDFSGVTVLLNANGSGTMGNYTLSPLQASATVTAGSSATYTFTITPINHYNGTVTFACSNLPALSKCSFNPTSVTLNGNAAVTVSVTITTAAVSASLKPVQHSSTILAAGMSGLGLFGMLLAGSWKKRSRLLGVLAGFVILIMTFSLAGCGGVSTGGSGKAAPTTTALKSSAGTIMVGGSVTFTANVSSSSGTPTGSVTLLDGSTTLGTVTLSNGDASFTTTKLAAGVHSITASYAGTSSFAASTSSAVSETVDNPGTKVGTYTVTITATGTAGTNNGNTAPHSANVSLTVQ